jgi:hypothetical protein
MSERDLPNRLERYDGGHISLRRVALTKRNVRGLPSFSVEEKSDDKRYDWFKREYGGRCWELDAMDPNDLRDLVERSIRGLIDHKQWDRDMAINEAERQSLKTAMDGWRGIR